MVNKYPCCSDCGTKLTHVISNTKSTNEHMIRFYYCKKCDVDVIRIKRQVQMKDEVKYRQYIFDFAFKHIKK